MPASTPAQSCTISAKRLTLRLMRMKGKVEQALARLDLAELRNQRYFVAGLPDERLGQVVTLVVEHAGALAPDTTQQMLATLRAALDRFAAPRQVVTVPRFAETPTGKIDRAKSLEIERG